MNARLPQNIALLIDAENAPASKIQFIINELATYGVVNIRRAYGNWTKPGLSAWEKALIEYAISPVQHFDLVKGKNGSDMALLIEAMDILYTKSVSTFCLVSSDCDFTPLVLRLRAEGKQVIGFGEHKTPMPLINSCTHFLFIDEPPAAPKQPSETPQEANSRQLSQNLKLINRLRSAVEAHEAEDGWAPLGQVGNHLSNQGPFDSRNYGFSKLSDLFNALEVFKVRNVATATGKSILSVRVVLKNGRAAPSPLTAPGKAGAATPS